MAEFILPLEKLIEQFRKLWPAVKSFWKQAGVKVGYMTSVRWRTCDKFERVMDMKDLKRGDVLVFSGKSASSGHVGIYLGGGKMIDAGSSAGKVVIRDSIHTDYWEGHFLMGYHIWD